MPDGDAAYGEINSGLSPEDVKPTKSFHSTLYLDTWLTNRNPRSKAGTEYLPVTVLSLADEEAYLALFTEKEVEKAVERASKNVEDFEGVEYSAIDPEMASVYVIETIEKMSMVLLFKLWVMKKLGIVTQDSLRRLINGPEENQDG